MPLKVEHGEMESYTVQNSENEKGPRKTSDNVRYDTS
jgi:hypothetical protein